MFVFLTYQSRLENDKACFQETIYTSRRILYMQKRVILVRIPRYFRIGAGTLRCFRNAIMLITLEYSAFVSRGRA